MPTQPWYEMAKLREVGYWLDREAKRKMMKHSIIWLLLAFLLNASPFGDERLAREKTSQFFLSLEGIPMALYGYLER